MSTGAPRESELAALLEAQELTISDLEANRAGRVSERQVDQVNRLRRRLWTIFAGVAGGGLVIALAMSGYFYRRDHDPVAFVMPAAMLVFIVLLYGLFALKLQVPSVANQAVTLVEGPVEGFLGVTNGGGYVVSIRGVRYKGVARKLGRDLMPKGRNVKAYVVPERTMVVAIEPA